VSFPPNLSLLKGPLCSKRSSSILFLSCRLYHAGFTGHTDLADLTKSLKRLVYRKRTDKLTQGTDYQSAIEAIAPCYTSCSKMVQSLQSLAIYNQQIFLVFLSDRNSGFKMNFNGQRHRCQLETTWFVSSIHTNHSFPPQRSEKPLA
jgi:hypothetical protein